MTNIPELSPKAKGGVLADLTTEIKTELDAVRAAVETAAEHAISVGRLLGRAKELAPHGNWLPWLEGNFGLSDRTARAYMQLARRTGEMDGPNRQRVAVLPLREAMKAVARAVQDQEDPPPPKVVNPLPTASQARIIAAETGIATEARDGMIYLGATKEETAARSAKHVLILDTLRAVERINGINVTSKAWVEISKPVLIGGSNLSIADLDNAINRLQSIRKELKADRKIVEGKAA